jgi:hypothetical protein
MEKKKPDEACCTAGCQCAPCKRLQKKRERLVKYLTPKDEMTWARLEGMLSELKEEQYQCAMNRKTA